MVIPQYLPDLFTMCHIEILWVDFECSRDGGGAHEGDGVRGDGVRCEG